jgi:ABC-type antimicrobial peptide transport system permease subunit
MQAVLEDSAAQQRFQMLLATVFAATALVLASLGIYGVVSYAVARRTSEMGIRMALGAPALPVLSGLAAGMAVAIVAGNVLLKLLYEVSPRDPATLAGVAVMLGLVALAACILPARRAARVDPLAALRCE